MINLMKRKMIIKYVQKIIHGERKGESKQDNDDIVIKI